MNLTKSNKNRRRNVLANAIENSKSRAKSVAVRTASELSGIPVKETERIANFFGVDESTVRSAESYDRATVANYLRNR